MKNQTNALQHLISSAIIFFTCMAPFARMAAQPVAFDHPTSHGGTGNYLTTWTVPSGVTAITIHAWGGGGGGNGNPDLPSDAVVGGGGGAYSTIEGYSVTPGQQLSISVGYGGALQTGGFADVGLPGGISSVSVGGNAIIRACGGTYMNPIAGSYQANSCTPVGTAEDGQYPAGTSRLSATATGGNAGGMAAGGGAGGAAGELGQVPGGGGGGGVNVAKTGAAGRVVIITDAPVGLSPQNPFNLLSISPNPFTGSTRISFANGIIAPSSLRIFDLAGRLLKTQNIESDGQTQSITIGQDLGPGIYLVQIREEATSSQRIIRIIKQ